MRLIFGDDAGRINLGFARSRLFAQGVSGYEPLRQNRRNIGEELISAWFQPSWRFMRASHYSKWPVEKATPLS
ncbi:hypothetical protein [Rhizobium sp. 768_B6_N1_8]|uniref:hypothetical protein n=1 Tax=unclassified Rhizobium TaxID=2613769 RepID=UPI003F1E5BF3